MSSGFKFDTSTQTFLPDISELTLFCENQKVGACSVDFVHYIDKQPKIEKAVIAQDALRGNLGKKLLLVGDDARYPGAFITFRIKVETIPEANGQVFTPSSQLSGRHSQLSRRSGSSHVSVRQGFEDSERIETMNQDIDSLKQKYQPIISENA